MHHFNKLHPLAQLLLRLAVGAIFIYHGLPKALHPETWTQNFSHMGFPPYFAYISATLEVVGGAMLMLGIGTRIVALLLAGEMAIALWRVHLPQGPLWKVGGYELPMLLCISAFMLLTTGPGIFSLDHAFFRRGQAGASKPAK